MAKKGGKNKGKGKKTGGAAAAATANMPTEAVNLAKPKLTASVDSAPTQQVEETIATTEDKVESIPTPAVEAASSVAPATTVATTAESATKGPATAPPNFTEAASNAAKIAFPTTEGQTIQDAVDKAQASKMGRIGSLEGEATNVLPETTVKESTLTTGTVESGAATSTALPDRSKELETAAEAHKRPHENGLTTKEEDQKPPKIAKMDDVPAVKTAAPPVAVGKENVATAPVAPAGTTLVQPQMVPGLGADPTDHTSKSLEVPGLSDVSSKDAAPAASPASKQPQAVEAVADAAEKKLAPVETQAKEETVSKPVAAASGIAATGAAATVGASTIDTAKEETAGKPVAAASGIAATGAAATVGATTIDTAKEMPAVTKPSAEAPVTGPTLTSTLEPVKEKVTDVKEKAKEAVKGPETPPVAAAPSAAATGVTGLDTSKATSTVDAAKEQAKEVTPPEQAHTAPAVSQPGTATTAPTGTAEPIGMPSSIYPQAEKAKEVAQEAQPTNPVASPAAQAARAAHEAQTGTDSTPAAQPEEGKTVPDQAQDVAGKEAAKIEKRKSGGGFWGWVKRKVKGA
ncbi:hypothetical protein P175DRAFT_0495473 [Aspergillus ochraceoroseus IBT 24754]|uniref:Uncharacterized protein n=1 Tax=Aspergillus ochraceoroseus IBT 24754 TaxID=1392256 RepID=A0A2T5LP66_9EURO|nr:uncharacterized protein P175DRAFT_0495473 [Aspergillus ochraceoroseus IBT 24754]PTU18070.1 hypothetical protein P175DRAFT_0495473 [Aspergillus ochraceoroseus IBT 24754]